MFKKSSLAVILSLLILSLLLASCNLPTNNNGLSEEMEKQTSVAQTVVALQTQMSVNTLAPANTAEPTAQPIPPTATMTSTVAIPTAQPTATNTPQPSYRIGNVTDLNYTDNTVVDPGVAFTKTWRVTNTGTATWGSNFKIVFISGDRMNGPSSQPLGKSVAPGGSIDISVTLTAPSELKTYQGYWMLQTESGSNFGFGDKAENAFWVKIVVSKAFAVTAGTPSYTLATPYTCPVSIPLYATITSTTAGTVTYYFKTSLGDTAAQSLVFTAAGSKTSETLAPNTLTATATSSITVTLYVDVPNHQDFGTITIPITCP